MTIYGVVKRAYHLLPRPMRLSDERGPLGRVLGRIKGSLQRFASHDDLYDANYYATTVEPYAQQSADVMSSTYVGRFAPRRVIDVGCGTGNLLMCLKAHGVPGVGLEYSEAALAACRSRGLDVRKFDIENDNDVPDHPFDLVVSTEVAEHLPESCADAYVQLLTGLGNTIAMTAALPGQGGAEGYCQKSLMRVHDQAACLRPSA